MSAGKWPARSPTRWPSSRNGGQLLRRGEPGNRLGARHRGPRSPSRISVVRRSASDIASLTRRRMEDSGVRKIALPTDERQADHLASWPDCDALGVRRRRSTSTVAGGNVGLGRGDRAADRAAPPRAPGQGRTKRPCRCWQIRELTTKSRGPLACGTRKRDALFEGARREESRDKRAEWFARAWRLNPTATPMPLTGCWTPRRDRARRRRRGRRPELGLRWHTTR